MFIKFLSLSAKSLQSCPTPCNPIDYSLPDSVSVGLSWHEYWSELPFPSPGDLPDPGIKPLSLMSSALAGGFFTTSATWEALMKFLNIYIQMEFLSNRIKSEN